MVGLVLGLIGALVLGRGFDIVLISTGSILVVLGLIAPRWLKPLYVPWMTISLVLGFVMTRVLLTLVFVGMVTPLGVIMRLCGRDPLHRKPDPKARSYWISKTPHANLKKHLERYY